jgi:hypothetical protein
VPQQAARSRGCPFHVGCVLRRSLVADGAKVERLVGRCTIHADGSGRPTEELGIPHPRSAIAHFTRTGASAPNRDLPVPGELQFLPAEFLGRHFHAVVEGLLAP